VWRDTASGWSGPGGSRPAGRERVGGGPGAAAAGLAGGGCSSPPRQGESSLAITSASQPRGGCDAHSHGAPAVSAPFLQEPKARTRVSQSPLHCTEAQLAGTKAEEAADGPAFPCQPLPMSWGKLPGSGLRRTAVFHMPRSPDTVLTWASLPHCPVLEPCQLPRTWHPELPRAPRASPALAQVPRCLHS